MSSRHKTVALKTAKEMNQPRPVIVKNLLTCSQSHEFDDAKEEWTVQSLIDESSEGFSNHCHLCHTPNLKYNFILENALNGTTIQVGSTCILRFGVGLGKMDVDSGAIFLNNMIEEKELINFLQTYSSRVMVLHPEGRTLKKYYESLKRYFDLRGITAPTQEQLGLVIFGIKWEEQSTFNQLQMKRIFYNPGSIEVSRTKRTRPTHNPKEGTTWGHKRRRNVETTLARSASYSPEGRVVDNR